MRTHPNRGKAYSLLCHRLTELTNVKHLLMNKKANYSHNVYSINNCPALTNHFIKPCLRLETATATKNENKV